ncbi:acyltransferase family protein [Pedobacter lithocola]|uniref:Acyltransferase family protein n=1 Tax=Pedobacter lithocola TaxID=1908239 RepID=A0ABV8P4W4_9SPHI
MNEYLSLKLKVISFFSMILVVFLHSYNLVVNLDSEVILLDNGYSSFIQIFLSQGICRVAVPLFFSISGYLFFLNSEGHLGEFFLKFSKRLKTIVIPYLFWSISWLLLFFILQSITRLGLFFSGKHIIDYSAKEFLATIFINPIPYQLWFLRDLMFLVVIAPLLFYLIKKTKYLFLVSILIIWIFDFNLMIIANESLFFFVLGSFISINNNQALKEKITKVSFIYILLWIIILLVRTSLIQYSFESTFVISLLHKIGVLIGGLAMWSMYDTMIASKREFEIYNYSFFIFVFHEPMLSFVKKIFFYLSNKSELLSLVIYFVAPVLVIAICLFVGSLLKRVVPKFYLFICGGR